MINQQIGVLGGTFDPVHNGHLSVAGKVKEAFKIQTVVFIPAAEPPHKQGTSITPFADRLAMLKLAVTDIPSFQVSAIEAGRQGPSYSIDTLQLLKKEFSTTTELFFIIGSDAFAEIASWKNYSTLPELAHFIIITRSFLSIPEFDGLIRQSFPDYTFDKVLNCWRKSKCSSRLYAFSMEPVLISSTKVRNRLRQGFDISGMVPPAVIAYIEHKSLYKRGLV